MQPNTAENLRVGALPTPLDARDCSAQEACNCQLTAASDLRMQAEASRPSCEPVRAVRAAEHICDRLQWAAVVQESNRNHLRDFVDIAGPLGVSHFLILTATANAAYLRLVKTPRVRPQLLT